MSSGLIFVSCGQLTVEERELGSAVCHLISSLTPHTPYFAELQTSLHGLTKNILESLEKAVGIVAIMHPRGTVMYVDHDGQPRQHLRASVWIEQELAIAAFLTQVAKQPLKVQAFIHADIHREGMRDHLHLNPLSFREDSEVLDRLTHVLEDWRDIPIPLAGEEFEKVRVRSGIQYIDTRSIRLLCTNESDEEVLIQQIELWSQGILLTDPPLTAEPSKPWTIAPRRDRPICPLVRSEPMKTLIDLHRNQGVAFEADLSVVLRSVVRGRYKAFQQKHRVRRVGSDIFQVVDKSPI